MVTRMVTGVEVVTVAPGVPVSVNDGVSWVSVISSVTTTIASVFPEAVSAAAGRAPATEPRQANIAHAIRMSGISRLTHDVLAM
ncbi:hypothetical protein HerbRD11066_32610 [Herbidospora sp. RD11066]